ncbi:MAG: hypothetical protein KC561_06380, partial [Myxococcales bacterium]|nr:hypothetical protein [Myxococcales bacterium]
DWLVDGYEEDLPTGSTLGGVGQGTAFEESRGLGSIGSGYGGGGRGERADNEDINMIGQGGLGGAGGGYGRGGYGSGIARASNRYLVSVESVESPSGLTPDEAQLHYTHFLSTDLRDCHDHLNDAQTARVRITVTQEADGGFTVDAVDLDGEGLSDGFLACVERQAGYPGWRTNDLSLEMVLNFAAR